jgi:hypothetical protein
MAQGTTGKIEGRVRDQAGAPIANAQVFIVGTTFQTQTSPAGYYFLNNVPAGSVTLQAGFIGYKSAQVTAVRVLGGQTITQDVALEATPFEVEELTVTAAEIPLVPRDQVTTKHRLGGAFGDDLPVDRIVNALALQPGVVASDAGDSLSIRGGRADEAVIYIDGVPTSPGNRGSGFVFGTAANPTGGTGNAGTGLVATNAFEEASVTTGSSSAEFGNAQSGVVSISTKSGGPTYSGSFGYATDEMFGGSQQGINFFNASIGGPIAGGLTFFVAGQLEGMRSTVLGKNSDDFPLFVVAGVDTTVAVLSALGDPTADTTFVDIERYAVYRGKSDAFAGSSNADIANNYGFDTKGIRRPGTGASNYKVSGKLNYTFGTGSRVSITGLATQNQIRQDFDLSNPQDHFAQRSWNKNLTLNWTQNLSKSAERALALEVFGSYQTDRQIFAPLTRESEQASYQPFGGIYIKPYEFLWDFDNFPVNDELINNFKNNIIGSRRSPFDLEDRDQYRESDTYRNNPWGRQDNFNSTGVGAEDGGPEGRLQMYKEDRYIGKANLDWQLDRYNRIKLGGEYTKYKMTVYTHQLTSQAFSDIFRGEPTRYNFFIQDRLDLGDVVLEGGLRYDYYNTEAIRPFLLDRNPNNPTFNDYVYFPRTNTYLGALDSLEIAQNGPGPSDCPVETDDLGVTGCSKTVFRQDESHNYLSPHVQVAFPVTDRTNFRLSYAHQVQTPDFGLIYGGMNTDLAVTNTNHVYGSDLDFGRTITFEFGIRHSFNDDMVLDIAAYNKDNISNAAGRLVRFADPAKNINQDIRLMTNADFGNTKGIDLRLDRRFGNLFNGTVSYTFQDAKATGSDPRTYINFGSRIVQQLTGGNQPPPQAILPLNTSRPHSLAGSFALTFPNDWREGTGLGSILKNVGIFATFRLASGTTFTRCPAESGNENVLSGQVCAREFEGDQNGARLPTFKQLDLRLTKGFALRGVDVTLYADARNVLNFENIVTVFATTNDTRNVEQEEIFWRSDSSSWATEGSANGVYDDVTGDLDLTFGSGATQADQGMCANWQNQAGDPNAANCVYMILAEQRYGDGDGVYTLAERRSASDAAYGVTGLNIGGTANGAGGKYSFLGAERAVRVGIELNF